GQRQPGALLESSRADKGPHDRGRARVVDARPQPLPRRDPRPRGGIGRDHEAEVGAGTGGRGAVATDESALGTEGLGTGDLLLDDRRHEGVDDEAGAGHAPALMPTPRLGDEWVVRHEAVRVVLLTEEDRRLLEQPLRPRPPRADGDPALALLDEATGDRAVGGRPRDPPAAAPATLGAARRIRCSATERRE